MPRKPPPKQKGRAHNPRDDELLLQLWKALRIGNPKITKAEFGRIAQQNYYQKNARPDQPTETIEPKSIVRHLNRLLAQER